MGAAQSLETLDDMMRCDGCRGSNKDVPDHEMFNVNPPKSNTESKDERLARLVPPRSNSRHAIILKFLGE